ncbi:MAG: hypothetical protein K1X74_08465 [Pirellulales bacterium]|nr:hypothetical protein [Pirellulales bacterium]
MRARIAAELADHLALATAAAQQSGATDPEDAARRQFGNFTWVTWQCWWINAGGQIMLRAALFIVMVATTSVLCLLSMQMSRVTSDLSALAAAQREILAAQNDQSQREITGRLYLGSPDQPAVGTGVEIRALPSLEVFANLTTDQEGRFCSGILPPGTYAVLAPLIGTGNPEVVGNQGAFPGWQRMRPIFNVQSAPITLPTLHHAIEMDVELLGGQLEIELSRDVPLDVGNAVKVPIVWDLQVIPLDLWALPWSPNLATQPPAFPAMGPSIALGFSRHAAVHELDTDRILRFGSETLAWPSGRYFVIARLTIVPEGGSGGGLGGGGGGSFLEPSDSLLFRLWKFRLNEQSQRRYEPPRPKPNEQVVHLVPKKIVRLSIATPREYLDRVTRIVDKENPSDEELKSVAWSDPLPLVEIP